MDRKGEKIGGVSGLGKEKIGAIKYYYLWGRVGGKTEDRADSDRARFRGLSVGEFSGRRPRIVAGLGLSWGR